MINKKWSLLIALLSLHIGAQQTESIKTRNSSAEKDAADREIAQLKRDLKVAHDQINDLQLELEKAQQYPLLDAIFSGANGFLIPQEEKNSISHRGGAPTYGEIKYPSLDAILHDLNVDENDVFYDLGSGVGKTVMQAHLNYPFQKTVGVELAPTRHKQAEAVADKLRNRMLEFRQEDMLTTDLSDATVIYMCSTCFSDDLMGKLLDRFTKLKPGLVVITLKELPDRAKSVGFDLIKKYTLPMSWSAGNSVYVYKYTKPRK